MFAHVVLFTPKPSTSAEDRETFVAVAGRPYDALATTAYEYPAVLESASRDDLNRYLDHPAHTALAQEFYDRLQVAAAYDFDVVDGAGVRTLVQT